MDLFLYFSCIKLFCTLSVQAYDKAISPSDLKPVDGKQMVEDIAATLGGIFSKKIVALQVLYFKSRVLLFLFLLKI